MLGNNDELNAGKLLLIFTTVDSVHILLLIVIVYYMCLLTSTYVWYACFSIFTYYCTAIGIAREHCALANNGLDTMLIEIQSRLFDVGAAVATPLNSSETKRAYTKVRKREPSKSSDSRLVNIITTFYISLQVVK